MLVKLGADLLEFVLQVVVGPFHRVGVVAIDRIAHRGNGVLDLFHQQRIHTHFVQRTNPEIDRSTYRFGTQHFDRASNELVVDYRLSHSVEEPSPIPDIFAFGPNGFQAPLKVSKVAAGHYRGRLAIGQNQGLFRVRPAADSRAFPEIGFYRQEDEMLEYGNNETLLKQIAAATGGHYNPSPQAVFDAAGRSIRTNMNLWPGLLGLALLLNLAELILRKWKGIAEALHLGAREPAEAAAN